MKLRMRRLGAAASASLSLGIAMFCAFATPAWADSLETTVNTVAGPVSGVVYSTPAIGDDPTLGNYIVYSEASVVDGVVGNSSLAYQLVTSTGAPTGAPVVFANAAANQWLPGASGGNIAYTLSPTVASLGNIVLYSPSTGQAVNLTTSGDSWAPKISGNNVVWTEVLANGAGQVVLAQIPAPGAPVQTAVISGPIPSASDATIGDRLIVWSQDINGYEHLAYYDMNSGLSYALANQPGLNQTGAETQGAWIVYEDYNNTGPTSIMLYNVDTGALTTVAANGLDPQISGNLITYTSTDASGQESLDVYRIAQGDTFTIADNAYLEDLSGNLVTYIDSNGDTVFDASLTFIPSATPVPAALPLFASGLGALGLFGWRRKRKAQAVAA